MPYKLLHAHNEDEYYKVMPCTDEGESALVNVGPKSEDFSWFILVAQRYVLRHINYNAQVFITAKSTSGLILSFVITMAFDTCTTVRFAIQNGKFSNTICFGTSSYFRRHTR